MSALFLRLKATMSVSADPRPASLPRVDAAQLGMVLDNSYANELTGLHAPWNPSPAPQPSWLALNTELAQALGLNADAIAGADGLAVFSGQALPTGASPVAQAYAGHQFGHFSPQLGDGRALLLGEVVDPQGQRRDIAFKGSGRTPFSRGGDGKAAVGPVLREYLMGEAMQALGIPTTRALAAIATGEQVARERPLPGAVLVRVAASHLRVGTFQFFAAREDQEKLKRLADYAINRHDPDLAGQPDQYLGLLRRVAERQATLIAQWMGVGFIHGVMNTDNMTISGETIDYGPCAFMEAHAPDTVFSSIDRDGRYAYANQPLIARWNLARLAEALLSLVHEDSDQAIALVSDVIDAFPALYQAQWLAVFRRKLGLVSSGNDAEDTALIEDFLALLHTQGMDHTLAFRHLADAVEATDGQAPEMMALAAPPGREPLLAWLQRWQQRLVSSGKSPPQLAVALRAANPLYIPRNHRVEEALQAATERGDLVPFERLLTVLKAPFDVQPGSEAYALPASVEQQAGYQTFCGT
ncbi:protein adenylyltransferase SelO [Hydrogenophaga sp. PAMC20947]|uniref:protein adenylyltransferase SelO n=1 Tax=Hydrogenophaga sp. PAMC20947 TaxID=2565558 RepID=UPI001FFAD7C3|nr:YdiU family protein [Hydrogenophaga sp. PAMC20947]